MVLGQRLIRIRRAGKVTDWVPFPKPHVPGMVSWNRTKQWEVSGFSCGLEASTTPCFLRRVHCQKKLAVMVGDGEPSMSTMSTVLCHPFSCDRPRSARNKCIASSNKCLTSSNKKLLETSATLLGARSSFPSKTTTLLTRLAPRPKPRSTATCTESAAVAARGVTARR